MLGVKPLLYAWRSLGHAFACGRWVGLEDHLSGVVVWCLPTKKKDRSSYDSCEYNHPPNVKNQVNFTEVVWSPLGYKGVWSLSIHLQTMSSNASEEASTWRNQLGPILALCSCSLVYWKVILDKSPQQKKLVVKFIGFKIWCQQTN